MKKFEDVNTGEVFASTGFFYHRVPQPELSCECEFCQTALLNARNVFTDNLSHFCPDDMVRQVELTVQR